MAFMKFSTEVPSLSQRLVLGLLAALILAHVALAVAFSNATPYRTAGILRSQRDPQTGGPAKVPDIGAPDERQHANYVQRLISGEGYPIFNPKDPNLGENYQGHQPPAFYTLEAGWAKIAGVSDVSSPDAGPKLRFLNALLGGANIAGIFFLGLWGFKRTDVALIAAAFAALLPMNCALSGAISNDVLLYALCSWSLAIMGLVLNDGWTVKRAVALGLVIGLAMLTKTTAIALLPILALTMWMKRPTVKMGALPWALAIGLAIGWWARNQSLYGDPFAIKAFNQAFVGSPQASTFIAGLGAFTYWTSWFGWWSMRSFYGAFGYMDIFLNETGMPAGQAQNTLYRLLLAVSFVAGLGWIGSTASGVAKRVPKIQVLNGIFTILVVLLFIRFNMQYFQAQARYVFPALGPIACGFALGALHLAKERWIVALAAVALILGGTSGYAVSRLPDEFALRMVKS